MINNNNSNINSNSNSNNINILFYSKKCQTCNNLINILNNENLLPIFDLFCVDGQLNLLPSYIKIVPTMIVHNINKPLVGSQTFDWIKTIKYLKNKKNNISDDSISGWNENEMAGKSDIYAYKSSNNNNAFSHSFYDINSDKKQIIYTSPEIDKIDNNKQTILLNNINNTRSLQDKEYSKLHEQQQFDHIYNKLYSNK